MALSTVNFKVTFDYAASTKEFDFEDTTDYSGQGVSKAVAAGVFKIVAPDGSVVYNNTNFGSPDIDPDTSLTFSGVPLPLMGDGSVMQGDYVFTYTVQVAGGSISQSYTVPRSKTVTLNYSEPTIDLDITVDCNLPLLTSTDNTSYAVNGITPTINSRDHRIQYPAVANKAEIDGGDSKTVTTSTVYVVKNQNLQYTSTITTLVTYSLGGDAFIYDSISGATRADVACDPNLCDVYCGIHTLWDKLQAAKGTAREEVLREKFEYVCAIAFAASQAIRCGKSADVSEYLVQIKKIGQFDDGCGCSNGEPVLVQGLNGNGQTFVVDAGGGIDVTVVTAGGTTTYTVELEPALLTKLNNSYNTTVSAGSGITVTETTDASGNKNYEVANTLSISTPDILTFDVTITMNPGKVPTVTINDSKVYGNVFSSGGLSVDNNNTGSSWGTSANSFQVSGFLSAPTTHYMTGCDIMESTLVGGSSTKADDGQTISIEFVEWGGTNDQHNISIVTSTGAPMSGALLNTILESVRFNITFMA